LSVALICVQFRAHCWSQFGLVILS